MVINQSKTSNKSGDKVNIIENTNKNSKTSKDQSENSVEKSYKISNNLTKFEETSKLSKLNR